MQTPADRYSNVDNGTSADPVAAVDSPAADAIDAGNLDIDQTVGTATRAASWSGATTETLPDANGANEDDLDNEETARLHRNVDTKGFDVAGIKQSIGAAADGWIDAAAALIRERPIAVIASAAAVGWLFGRPSRD